MKCKIYTWLTPCHRWWHYQRRICRFLSSNSRPHVASLLVYSCAGHVVRVCHTCDHDSLVSPLCVLSVMWLKEMNLSSMWQVPWLMIDYVCSVGDAHSPCMALRVWYSGLTLRPALLTWMNGQSISTNVKGTQCTSNDWMCTTVFTHFGEAIWVRHSFIWNIFHQWWIPFLLKQVGWFQTTTSARNTSVSTWKNITTQHNTYTWFSTHF